MRDDSVQPREAPSETWHPLPRGPGVATQAERALPDGTSDLPAPSEKGRIGSCSAHARSSHSRWPPRPRWSPSVRSPLRRRRSATARPARARPPSDEARRGHPLYNDKGAIDWRETWADAARLAKARNKLVFIEMGRES